MEQYKKYLKPLLETGIFFGVFGALFMGITHLFNYGIFECVKRGGLGFLVLGSLGVMMQIFVNLLKPIFKMFNIRRARNMRLALPYDDAFDLCLNSLGLIKKCSILTEDRFCGKIEANADVGWGNLGDLISFDLQKIDNNHTKVEISSEPVIFTLGAAGGWGGSGENVKKIVFFLFEKS